MGARWSEVEKFMEEWHWLMHSQWRWDSPRRGKNWFLVGANRDRAIIQDGHGQSLLLRVFTYVSTTWKTLAARCDGINHYRIKHVSLVAVNKECPQFLRSLNILPASSICFIACALPILGLVNSDTGEKQKNLRCHGLCTPQGDALHKQIYSTSELLKFYKVTGK